jgi:glycosyltransferase involved in cell wall biosynthesis
MNAKLGLVAIGRNEGPRLASCLASVRDLPHRVYVDSGSTDGSVQLAEAEGCQIVNLVIPPPFTAARARNAGIAFLLSAHPNLEFVQMIDGDCEIRTGWIDAALTVLRGSADVAVVYGRRRERHPERSVYNALCDDEWNTPIGDSPGCGGDALFRVAALREVDFYNPSMIAGEDSELSMRLRKKGWRVLRIDVEMTYHDAAINRLGQWWSRTRRSGHGFAEMAFLHPDARIPNWPRTVRSIVVWGALMPLVLLVAIVLAVTWSAWCWIAAALFFLPWPLRVAQLAQRQKHRGLSPRVAFASGFLLMLGKLPQLIGLIGYHFDRISGRASRLIEYKGPEAA